MRRRHDKITNHSAVYDRAPATESVTSFLAASPVDHRLPSHGLGVRYLKRRGLALLDDHLSNLHQLDHDFRPTSDPRLAIDERHTMLLKPREQFLGDGNACLAHAQCTVHGREKSTGCVRMSVHHVVEGIDAADVARLDELGLDVADAVALVAEVEWSDEILNEYQTEGED